MSIKKGMSNVMSVLLILLGTIIGSKGHESLITGGEYNYEVGLTFGVVVFGALALVDLVYELLKSAWLAVKAKRQSK